MSVIFLLLTVSTLVAAVFLLGFIWAVRAGQYEDGHSPAVRILMDDLPRPAKKKPGKDKAVPTACTGLGGRNLQNACANATTNS